MPLSFMANVKNPFNKAADWLKQQPKMPALHSYGYRAMQRKELS